eukprot:4361821-Karenia_brevis.AAC.1
MGPRPRWYEKNPTLRPIIDHDHHHELLFTSSMALGQSICVVPTHAWSATQKMAEQPCNEHMPVLPITPAYA